MKKVRKELDGVMEEYRGLVGKVYGKSIKDAKERDKAKEAPGEVTGRMSALRGKLPPNYENHGWIWLFL